MFFLCPRKVLRRFAVRSFEIDFATGMHTRRICCALPPSSGRSTWSLAKGQALESVEHWAFF